MKIKFCLLLSAIFFTVSGSAQDELAQYLQTHQYSFSLEKGFDKPTSDMLQQKLSNYKLVLQSEAGSHYLKFYDKLQLTWLYFLNTHFGVTHFFKEVGHSTDILLNKYLETGDTTYLFMNDKTMWRSLYKYNQTQPSPGKLALFGIDFESRRAYVKALQLILPKKQPPQNIISLIELISNADATLEDCDYIVGINEKLKSGLLKNKTAFMDFFGTNYSDFERIVLNGRTCKETLRDRNPNMRDNFLSFDKEFNKQMYYGELGMAHTILKFRNAASMINDSDRFKDKVCVISLYCDNCTTPEEQPNNGGFRNIEKDIAAYFLPYCKSDFTLFDLSENAPLMKKYSDFGQFMIIAKNQH
jgi:hypothetical protein